MNEERVGKLLAACVGLSDEEGGISIHWRATLSGERKFYVTAYPAGVQQPIAGEGYSFESALEGPLNGLVAASDTAVDHLRSEATHAAERFSEVQAAVDVAKQLL